ncbi:MAG: flagellar hook-associated protein FlgL [Clostridiales bacterium]|mgnify:FL=1|jgi:flagellar hook-associated protein 3 FlgL|nr:flagellar hook-associated protein FlgL [Clostridiales bacterium]
MRITNGMLITNMMRNYNKNMKDLAKLQEHLASGKKILRPSDDPVAISRSLKLKADLAYNKQYVSNTDNALSWLESTELALKDLGDVLQRVREMAVKAGSGSLSLEDRAAIADEIQQLQNHVVQLGNATYADRYIFAGYKTDQPAFAEQGNQLVYQGDNGKIAYETGVGSRIDVNVIGGDGGAEIDKIYDVLERFKNDLMDPANPELDGYIGEIDQRIIQVLSLRSEAGAKVNRFELIRARLKDEEINFTNLLSQNEDADIAEIIVWFKEAENVYRASLATGARIIMPTLIDFLR